MKDNFILWLLQSGTDESELYLHTQQHILEETKQKTTLFIIQIKTNQQLVLMMYKCISWYFKMYTIFSTCFSLFFMDNEIIFISKYLRYKNNTSPINNTFSYQQ